MCMAEFKGKVMQDRFDQCEPPCLRKKLSLLRQQYIFLILSNTSAKSSVLFLEKLKCKPRLLPRLVTSLTPSRSNSGTSNIPISLKE